MTVEATIAPKTGSEESLRSRALDVLRTATLEAILASDEPLRTVDAARQVADELGLELNEEEMGGLATVVRMVLDSDPMFSQANRQWDLALRMGRAEGDRRKPVERALVDFIDLLGHPTEPAPVAVLAAALYGRDAEYYDQMLRRLVPGSSHFFPVGRSRVAIRRWLIDLSSDDPADVEFDNFEDTTALDALRKAAKGASGADAVSYAKSIIERAGKPVDNKALLFLVWCKFPDTAPEKVFAQLAREGSLALERGPVWVTAAESERVLQEIRKLAAAPDSITELVAASAPAEEEDLGLLAPTTVRVSDEDLDQVYDLMSREERTYRVPELCQQALEAFPGSRTYQGVHDSLLTRMREDSRFQWLGTERFRLSGTVPPEVEMVPEGLNYDRRDYLGEEGEEVDKAVDPADWKFNLDEQVLHYLVQDVGDDATAPGNPPARIDTSPPLHHYIAGTLYLRNSDRGFFPAEVDVAQVTLTLPDGNRLDLWINNRLGLVYGFKDWYENSGFPWVGGRLVFERGDQPDEFRMLYNGETEPLMDIGMERLQQLLPLRAEAVEEGMPLTEVVKRILQAHPELHFVTLFTEVNVVRRVRRAQVASVLSAQRYFTQSPQR
ncbi:MAG TPA: hypothetical protein VFU47_00955, partial [Armatimonadota bacterium]|nr:hypothetical protein [Armatimonadota bacterium]